jgi:peptide chain release factor subunit 3
MNPNAAAWTPNAGAVSFVPSWAPAPAPAQPAPEVVDAWDEDEEDTGPAAQPSPMPAATEGEPVAREAAEPTGEARQAQEERVAKLETLKPGEVATADPSSAALTCAPADAAEEVAAEAQEDAVESDDDPDEGFIEPPRAAGDHRKHVNVVFIGHVDAGKSTLCGQIMWLSGNIDDRTLQKYEDDAKAQNRESWKFAYAMDTNEEERAKGKTVEVGRSFFATENKRFTVLDAPGHKNFVPHMIGGASQADVGVLVIAARKGEFETGFEKGGQTREHITLAKTAGVKQLVVVINKMDDKTVEWSEERYNECVDKLTPFMKSSGFRPKKDCYWLPISALSGINVREPIPDGLAPWYT